MQHHRHIVRSAEALAAAMGIALASLNPMGRLGDIDDAVDAVDAVLYLEQAGFVTGEILHVDGGQSAGHCGDPARGVGPVEERNRRT
jgi:NAD(P)-dependent dehydrogenase (short-subunit alcohol dehydrogenase family)